VPALGNRSACWQRSLCSRLPARSSCYLCPEIVQQAQRASKNKSPSQCLDVWPGLRQPQPACGALAGAKSFGPTWGTWILGAECSTGVKQKPRPAGALTGAKVALTP
jgi:hypothetical protein